MNISRFHFLLFAVESFYHDTNIWHKQFVNRYLQKFNFKSLFRAFYDHSNNQPQAFLRSIVSKYVIPQTPVYLAQILNSILQWGDFNPGTLTFNPNSMKISNWTTSVANQMKNDLDWPGFTGFVAKIYQSQITRFWGKILNSNFCLCKKIDISQLWSSTDWMKILG